MRKRALWTEPLFGEAKQFHQMRRFRLRGLTKVNIEGVMIATGQNLKRLIKAKTDKILAFFKRIYLSIKLPQNASFSTGWVVVRLISRSFSSRDKPPLYLITLVFFSGWL
jgi:hypothetical protein